MRQVVAEQSGALLYGVDPQADLQLSRSYTPFGEELNSSSTIEMPFAFAGEMQNTSRLLSLRARYSIHCVQGASLALCDLSTETDRFTRYEPFSGYVNTPAFMDSYK